MTPPGMIDMIFDALVCLARKEPYSPHPGRMKVEGTMAYPEIVLEVIDPNPPSPDQTKTIWVISTKGIEQRVAYKAKVLGATQPFSE